VKAGDEAWGGYPPECSGDLQYIVTMERFHFVMPTKGFPDLEVNTKILPEWPLLTAFLFLQ
jgi:hypothetical protein